MRTWTEDMPTTHVGLTGRVLLADGKPATDALVELTNGMTAQTSTTADSAGEYTLPYWNNLTGHFELRIGRQGSASISFQLPPEGRFHDVTLQPAAPIKAKVVSAEGAPLAGVTVRVTEHYFDHLPGRQIQFVPREPSDSMPVFETTTTDTSGSFALLDTRAADYDLQLFGTGVVTQMQRIKAPLSSAEFRMVAAGGVLSGRTVLHGSGEPVAYTTVTATFSPASTLGFHVPKGSETLSDASGRYSFQGLEKGYWTLRARNGHLRSVPDDLGVYMAEGRPVPFDVPLYGGHTITPNSALKRPPQLSP